MMRKKTISPEAARIRMADLCARSEQCEHDIRQKLFSLGIESTKIAEIMEYLVSHKFIDNARFAGSYARDKCRFSGWGRNKIRAALLAKRIPSAMVSEGVSAIDDADYQDSLMRVAVAKSRSLDLHGDASREERMKLYRHLLSRGFESEYAVRAVKELAARSCGESVES